MSIFPMSKPRRLAGMVAVLLLALAHSAAHALEDCEINGVSVNPANGATTAGKTGTMACRDHDTGLPVREQQIQSGTIAGLMRYYDKGKLAKEQSVNARGKLDGRAREYSPSGQLLRDATYDDGHEVGLVRNYYPTGQLERVTYFADAAGESASAEFTLGGQLAALRCGDKPVLAPVADDTRLCGFDNKPSQVELFDDKGILRSRVSYLVGKRVRSEDLYDNGKVAAQVEIAGTQRIERRYSSEGVKRREVVSLIGEFGVIKQREQEFSERGSLMHDQRWSPSGEPLSDESYYLDGQPRSKAVHGVDGDPHLIEVTEFYDNGQRAAIGRYVARDRFSQTPIGTHQRFSDKGVLIAESVYDNEGRVTRERVWDASGKLERDEEVLQDGSRKGVARP
jgi:antitoxin component YwqK of YwqJK toxin-antitoxin module